MESILFRLIKLQDAMEKGEYGLARNSLNWIISRVRFKELCCERCKGLSDMQLEDTE